MEAGPYGQRGLAVRSAYLCIAVIWWCIERFRAGRNHGTVVLCYHGIREEEMSSFRWQMWRLVGRAIGPEGIGLSTPAKADGCRPRVCVTFDDGFVRLLTTALPLMDRLGVPATVFAVSGNLGQKPKWAMPAGHIEAGESTLSGEQIAEGVRRNLFRLGSHTVTHPHLNELRGEPLVRELQDSRAALERLAGRPVEDLALPFGAYDREVIEAARKVAYKRIFTLNECLVGGDEGDVIGRFSMTPGAWRIEFLLTCAGAYAWLHPWRRFVRRVRSLWADARPAADLSKQAT